MKKTFVGVRFVLDFFKKVPFFEYSSCNGLNFLPIMGPELFTGAVGFNSSFYNSILFSLPLERTATEVLVF